MPIFGIPCIPPGYKAPIVFPCLAPQGKFSITLSLTWIIFALGKGTITSEQTLKKYMESCLVFTCRRDCVLEIWDFGEKSSLPLAKTLAQMWTRKWQSTAVFLPGKPHGRRSLAGYSPWGCRESDTTERLHFSTDGQPKQEDRAWRMSVQCVCLSPALMQGLAQ